MIRKIGENLIEKMKQYVKTGIDLVGLVSLDTNEVGKKVKNVPIVTKNYIILPHRKALFCFPPKKRCV